MSIIVYGMDLNRGKIERFSVYSFIQEFIKDNRGDFIKYGGLSFAIPVFKILLSHRYGEVIDNMSNSDDRSTIINDNKRIFAEIVGLWTAGGVCGRAIHKLDATVISKLQSSLRKRMVSHFLDIYEEDYKDPKVGDLIAKIIKLPIIVRDMFHQLRIFIIPTIVMLIASTTYIMYIEPSIGIVYIIGILLLLGVLKKYSGSCSEQSTMTDKEHNELHEEITDLLTNILNVYSCDTVDSEMDRLTEIQNRYDSQYKKTIDCSASFKGAINMIALGMFGSTAIFAMKRYIDGFIELNKLTSILVISLHVVNHINDMSNEIQDFIFNIGIMKETENYINDNAPNIRSNSGKNADMLSYLPHGDIYIHEARIGYKGICYKDITFHRNEISFIIGNVGTGKSTLIKMLMKYIPYRGQIYIGNTDLANVSSKAIRKKIAYIPQQPRIFNRTIYDNIVYGMSNPVAPDVINNLLMNYNIKDLTINDLPRMAGKNGEDLSGGQKQLVLLLRALLSNKEILVFDEPTANLSVQAETTFIDIIGKIKRETDVTIIIITHEPRLIEKLGGNTINI